MLLGLIILITSQEQQDKTNVGNVSKIKRDGFLKEVNDSDYLSSPGRSAQSQRFKIS